MTVAEENFKRMDAEEFADLDPETVTLLDLRDENEFRLNGIEGSLNIPLDLVRTKLSSVPKDKPVVVCCKVGLVRGHREVLADREPRCRDTRGGYNTYLALLYGI